MVSVPNGLANPGDLDPTFGTGGTVITDFGSGDRGRDMAIQPNGKIVVAGGSCCTSGKPKGFALARYLPNGQLDTTFGAGGKVVSPIRIISGGDFVANAVAIQSDGKIVAAGGCPSCGIDFIFVVVRYHTNGQLDQSFGISGILQGTYGYVDEIQDVAIQPDGKILTVGTTIGACNGAVSCEDFIVTRLNPDGSVDPTFGVDGNATTDFGDVGYDPRAIDEAHAVALQTDGKIVVIGDSARLNPADPDVGHRRIAVARYTPNGLPDTSFNTTGKTTTSFFGMPGLETTNAFANAVAIQSDGTIVVAGVVNADFTLVRYLSNGALDTSFDGDGKVITDFNLGLTEVVAGLAIQPDNSIVAAGTGGSDFIVARYLTNGTLDANFGNAGATITDMGATDTASAVQLQCDGKIVLAGSSTNDFAVARYFGDDPVQLASVVSRKTHAGAGDFDIDLPVAATPGIECRTGGASGDYTLVFSFVNTLDSVAGASVSSGTGSVSSRDFGTDQHQYIVTLTGVANAQVITVDLTDVIDSVGNSGCTSAAMGVLLGDANANRLVNSTDTSLVQAQSGKPVTLSNFRMDVNANGLINSTDTSIVQSKSGTGLPSSP